MIRKIDFDEYNICLLSGNSIVRDSSISIINHLNSFEIDLDLSKHIVKRFIHSDLIFQICESILNCKTTNKIVVYYNTTDSDYSWYNSFFKTDDLTKFFEKSFKKYEKMLPIKIFNGKVSLDYITTEYKFNNEDIRILLTKIQQYNDSKTEDIRCFKKAKTFLEKNQLTYLSKNYFNTVKSKQIMYK